MLEMIVIASVWVPLQKVRGVVRKRASGTRSTEYIGGSVISALLLEYGDWRGTLSMHPTGFHVNTNAWVLDLAFVGAYHCFYEDLDADLKLLIEQLLRFCEVMMN